MALLARYFGAAALLALSGVGIAAESAAGLLISEATGLFGCMEDGYRRPIVLSLLFEGATSALLGTYLACAKETRCLASSAT